MSFMQLCIHLQRIKAKPVDLLEVYTTLHMWKTAGNMLEIYIFYVFSILRATENSVVNYNGIYILLNLKITRK